MFINGNNSKNLNSAKSEKENKSDNGKSQYKQYAEAFINIPNYLKGIQTGKTGAQRVASIWSIGSLFKGENSKSE